MALHKLSHGNSEQSSAVCYVVFCESMKGGENILAEPLQGGITGGTAWAGGRPPDRRRSVGRQKKGGGPRVNRAFAPGCPPWGGKGTGERPGRLNSSPQKFIPGPNSAPPAKIPHNLCGKRKSKPNRQLKNCPEALDYFLAQIEGKIEMGMLGRGPTPQPT